MILTIESEWYPVSAQEKSSFISIMIFQHLTLFYSKQDTNSVTETISSFIDNLNLFLIIRYLLEIYILVFFHGIWHERHSMLEWRNYSKIGILFSLHPVMSNPVQWQISFVCQVGWKIQKETFFWEHIVFFCAF